MKLFIAVLALSTLNVFAHPSDKNTIANIGNGSTLNVKQDLNFPAGVMQINFQKGRQTSKINEGPYCIIYVKNTELHDRVIEAGDVMKVTAVEKAQATMYEWVYGQISGSSTYLQVDKKAISAVECGVYKGKYPRDVDNTTMPNIGEVRKTFGKFIEITLAAPEKI